MSPKNAAPGLVNPRRRSKESTPKPTPGPYALAALDYLKAGWPPIPVSLLSGVKRPLVSDFTGGADNWPAVAQVREWIEKFPRASIGLRLPKTVIGLDVDMYDGKTGRQALGELVDRFGLLPPTWVSTSREDGSGIRLFRVYDGTSYRDPGPGVEVIRWNHRFVACAPSRHPRVGHPPYVWFRPCKRRWRRVDDEIPSLGDLPELPAAWVAGLPKTATGARVRVSPCRSAREWLRAHNDADGEACLVMGQTLTYYLGELATLSRYGSAHGAALAGVRALVGDTASGCRGGRTALVALWRAFEREVAGRRPRGVARREFASMLRGAIEKRPSPPPVALECDCDEAWGTAT